MLFRKKTQIKDHATVTPVGVMREPYSAPHPVRVAEQYARARTNPGLCNNIEKIEAFANEHDLSIWMIRQYSINDTDYTGTPSFDFVLANEYGGEMVADYVYARKSWNRCKGVHRPIKLEDMDDYQAKDLLDDLVSKPLVMAWIQCMQ